MGMGGMGGGGMGGGNPYAPPQGAPPGGYGPPGGGGYGGGPPGYGQGAPPQMVGEYEFNPEENHALSDLAMKMRFVGLMSIIFGVVIILGGLATCATKNVGGGFGNVIQGVFTIIVGVWTRSAATGFQRIVDTTGSDIANLMQALGELRRIYGMQRILIIIALVLLAVAFVFGIVAFFLLAARQSSGSY